MLNRMEMVRIFCTAAEAGSFREAATRLGISPQGVTRAIQALETELGESLFHRNTWSYQDLVDTRSAASIHRLILVRADAA